MPSLLRASIHSGQFPEAVQRDLLDSLASRQVNHKFHYDSFKQTQKWLELHQAYSPSRTDPDCAATYDRSFATAAARISAKRVHVVGLGCGGGQKDARILQALRAAGKQVLYTPTDVSTAMVIVATQAAAPVVGARNCFPLVCDLASPDDPIPAITRASAAAPMRLFTFFGMIPNFDPNLILPRLARLLHPGSELTTASGLPPRRKSNPKNLRNDDLLLLSANLAPGRDYLNGLRRVLPLYDNTLTRDWLMVFLLDLGVERADGLLRFSIEEYPVGSGLQRIVAQFRFHRPRQVRVHDHEFTFHAGDTIRLFFSYRHTPARLKSLLKPHGLSVLDQWLTRSGEEGVFLCCPPSLIH